MYIHLPVYQYIFINICILVSLRVYTCIYCVYTYIYIYRPPTKKEIALQTPQTNLVPGK